MNRIYGNHQQWEIGSTMGLVGTITTPDSNGNYTVTPEQSFEDSSDTTTYSCFTEYGGVKKTFYFKKKEERELRYYINCKILVTGDGNEISICGIIESYDTLMPIPVYDLLRQDVIDTHIKVYVHTLGQFHLIDFELSSSTWNGYEAPHFKYTAKFGDYNDNIPDDFGIGNLNTKNKTITSTYSKCIYDVNYHIY